MRRLFSIVMVIALFTSTCILNVSAESNDTVITMNEAKQLAILFVANNIENKDMAWDDNTRIGDTVTLYDENNAVTGYSVELVNGDTPNGYVVVSSNAYDKNIFTEYSSKDIPLYKVASQHTDKVYSVAPLEYYVIEDDAIMSVDGKCLTTQEFYEEMKNSKLEIAKISANGFEKSNSINYYVAVIREKPIDISIFEAGAVGVDPQVTGGQGTSISNPVTWLQQNYASNVQWTVKDSGSLEPNITAFTMTELESNVNNCSLTAITTVVYYYRHHKGYSNIDSSKADIYATVKAKAVARGYTSEGGTSYSVIDNILTDTFSAYGYSAKGNNDYLNLWSTIESEISVNSSPVIMSMTGGYYDNHTITIVGWYKYQNSTQSDIVRFLKVYDGWTKTSNRYVDYEKITLIKNITKVVQ